jgi:hypothetical protein
MLVCNPRSHNTSNTERLLNNKVLQGVTSKGMLVVSFERKFSRMDLNIQLWVISISFCKIIFILLKSATVIIILFKILNDIHIKI